MRKRIHDDDEYQYPENIEIGEPILTLIAEDVDKVISEIETSKAYKGRANFKFFTSPSKMKIESTPRFTKEQLVDNLKRFKSGDFGTVGAALEKRNKEALSDKVGTNTFRGTVTGHYYSNIAKTEMSDDLVINWIYAPGGIHLIYLWDIRSFIFAGGSVSRAANERQSNPEFVLGEQRQARHPNNYMSKGSGYLFEFVTTNSPADDATREAFMNGEFTDNPEAMARGYNQDKHNGDKHKRAKMSRTLGTGGEKEKVYPNGDVYKTYAYEPWKSIREAHKAKHEEPREAFHLDEYMDAGESMFRSLAETDRQKIKDELNNSIFTIDGRSNNQSISGNIEGIYRDAYKKFRGYRGEQSDGWQSWKGWAVRLIQLLSPNVKVSDPLPVIDAKTPEEIKQCNTVLDETFQGRPMDYLMTKDEYGDDAIMVTPEIRAAVAKSEEALNEAMDAFIDKSDDVRMAINEITQALIAGGYLYRGHLPIPREIAGMLVVNMNISGKAVKTDGNALEVLSKALKTAAENYQAFKEFFEDYAYVPDSKY